MLCLKCIPLRNTWSWLISNHNNHYKTNSGSTTLSQGKLALTFVTDTEVSNFHILVGRGTMLMFVITSSPLQQPHLADQLINCTSQCDSLGHKTVQKHYWSKWSILTGSLVPVGARFHWHLPTFGLRTSWDLQPLYEAVQPVTLHMDKGCRLRLKLSKPTNSHSPEALRKYKQKVQTTCNQK